MQGKDINKTIEILISFPKDMIQKASFPHSPFPSPDHCVVLSRCHPAQLRSQSNTCTDSVQGWDTGSCLCINQTVVHPGQCYQYMLQGFQITALSSPSTGDTSNLTGDIKQRLCTTERATESQKNPRVIGLTEKWGAHTPPVKFHYDLIILIMCVSKNMLCFFLHLLDSGKIPPFCPNKVLPLLMTRKQLYERRWCYLYLLGNILSQSLHSWTCPSAAPSCLISSLRVSQMERTALQEYFLCRLMSIFDWKSSSQSSQRNVCTSKET